MERLQAVGNDTENADGSGAETFVPLKEGGVEEQPEQQTEQEGNLEKKKRVHPAAGRVRQSGKKAAGSNQKNHQKHLRENAKNRPGAAVSKESAE